MTFQSDTDAVVSLAPSVHAPWASLLQTPVLLPPVLDLLWKDKGRPVGHTSCPMADSLSEMVANYFPFPAE